MRETEKPYWLYASFTKMFVHSVVMSSIKMSVGNIFFWCDNFIYLCVCAITSYVFCLFSHFRQCIFCAPHLNLSAIKRLCILIFVRLQFIFPFHFCCWKCRYLYRRWFFLLSVFAAVAVWFNCIKHHGW